MFLAQGEESEKIKQKQKDPWFAPQPEQKTLNIYFRLLLRQTNVAEDWTIDPILKKSCQVRAY